MSRVLLALSRQMPLRRGGSLCFLLRSCLQWVAAGDALNHCSVRSNPGLSQPVGTHPRTSVDAFCARQGARCGQCRVWVQLSLHARPTMLLRSKFYCEHPIRIYWCLRRKYWCPRRLYAASLHYGIPNGTCVPTSPLFLVRVV